MTHTFQEVKCACVGNFTSEEHICLGAEYLVLTGIFEVMLVTRLVEGGDQHRSRSLVATCSWVCLPFISDASGSNNLCFFAC